MAGAGSLRPQQDMKVCLTGYTVWAEYDFRINENRTDLMKFTLSWLKEYIDFGTMSAQEIADHLTMLGLEVDSVTPLFQDLASLQTGTVVSAEKHPNADKLTLCQVQTGETSHQIVCGAPNVRKDLKVVVALPGTTLPGDFKIKKSKIRGVASAGMLCSERELGLSSSHEGIMELPAETIDGQPFTRVMNLDDTVIEVDLTPNRADCASVIGIARELAGVTGGTLSLPVTDAVIDTQSSQFEVDIQNPELCLRYAGRKIEQVKIGPSPWWLRKRLLSVGLRPVNNVVDITNFVMLEYGQPLHAFDFQTLAGGKIVVRTPKKEEKTFTTLDGVNRTLNDNTLLICDDKRPVAVAGIMGGENSEISPATTTVLLESACFDPVSVRKSSKMLNISTDSSYRFERGVDPEGVINALNRATQLICELAEGKAENAGIDCFPGKRQPLLLELSVSRTNTILGLALSREKMMELLGSIEIPCSIKDADTLVATIPSFRIDLERSADLMEEVARTYGYDNIPITMPEARLHFPDQAPHRLKRLALAKELASIGFFEAINYSFISSKEIAMLGIETSDPRCTPVPLLNPLSEDQGVMRTTLLPGLLTNVRRNINFQYPAVQLFEIGKVFFPQKDQQPLEKTRLAGVLSGNRFGGLASPLYFKEQIVDIYDAKGVVEFIIKSMRLPSEKEKGGIRFQTPAADQQEPFVEQGYALDLLYQDKPVGKLGKIKSEILRNYSIKNDVFYFDLDYDTLCRVQITPKRFASLPMYPAVRRDISLIIAQHTASGELLSAVQNQKDALIEDVEIFDTFTGGKIPQGYKSISLRITYRSSTKTLTEKNVEKSHVKIVRMLTDQFGGSFRDA